MFRTAPHAEASEGSGASLGGRRAWWWGSGCPWMGFGVKVGAEYTDNRKKRGSLRRGKASCWGRHGARVLRSRRTLPRRQRAEPSSEGCAETSRCWRVRRGRGCWPRLSEAGLRAVIGAHRWPVAGVPRQPCWLLIFLVPPTPPQLPSRSSSVPTPTPGRASPAHGAKWGNEICDFRVPP